MRSGINLAIVTSCLTGGIQSKIIAAVFKENAEKRGHKVYVEIQSASEIEKKILDNEIEIADLIVISAIGDIVESDRFVNKNIVEIDGREIIRNCNDVLKKIEKIV